MAKHPASITVMATVDEWVVDAADDGPWRVIDYKGQPPWLSVRMRFAPTADGVAVAGIQVERTDGRAVTAADLRAVKLPPHWVLFGEAARRWYKPVGGPVRQSRSGRQPAGDERHRAIWNLWLQAREAAPRAPVRWMLRQLPVSDATARRWVRQARERAAELGWPEVPQQAPHFPRYGDERPAAEDSPAGPGSPGISAIDDERP